METWLLVLVWVAVFVVVWALIPNPQDADGEDE